MPTSHPQTFFRQSSIDHRSGGTGGIYRIPETIIISRRRRTVDPIHNTPHPPHVVNPKNENKNKKKTKKTNNVAGDWAMVR